jgi:hypothetical protein
MGKTSPAMLDALLVSDALVTGPSVEIEQAAIIEPPIAARTQEMNGRRLPWSLILRLPIERVVLRSRPAVAISRR